eukprot:TRINITY_DN7420_c0_g2_i1.p1 TRINITY_DN7420_c0_g2~~TRINITY_DN7420_c0_g2_i1.p1  ORF type:complete len:1505 (+),score=293.49 TRINITY_DN7420_c0_g2_i1:76-4515(+)
MGAGYPQAPEDGSGEDEFFDMLEECECVVAPDAGRGLQRRAMRSMEGGALGDRAAVQSNTTARLSGREEFNGSAACGRGGSLSEHEHVEGRFVRGLLGASGNPSVPLDSRNVAANPGLLLGNRASEAAGMDQKAVPLTAEGGDMSTSQHARSVHPHPRLGLRPDGLLWGLSRPSETTAVGEGRRTSDSRGTFQEAGEREGNRSLDFLLPLEESRLEQSPFDRSVFAGGEWLEDSLATGFNDPLKVGDSSALTGLGVLNGGTSWGGVGREGSDRHPFDSGLQELGEDSNHGFLEVGNSCLFTGSDALFAREDSSAREGRPRVGDRVFTDDEIDSGSGLWPVESMQEQDHPPPLFETDSAQLLGTNATSEALLAVTDSGMRQGMEGLYPHSPVLRGQSSHGDVPAATSTGVPTPSAGDPSHFFSFRRPASPLAPPSPSLASLTEPLALVGSHFPLSPRVFSSEPAPRDLADNNIVGDGAVSWSSQRSPQLDSGWGPPWGLEPATRREAADGADPSRTVGPLVTSVRRTRGARPPRAVASSLNPLGRSEHLFPFSLGCSNDASWRHGQGGASSATGGGGREAAVERRRLLPRWLETRENNDEAAGLFVGDSRPPYLGTASVFGDALTDPWDLTRGTSAAADPPNVVTPASPSKDCWPAPPAATVPPPSAGDSGGSDRLAFHFQPPPFASSPWAAPLAVPRPTPPPPDSPAENASTIAATPDTVRSSEGQATAAGRWSRLLGDDAPSAAQRFSWAPSSSSHLLCFPPLLGGTAEVRNRDIVSEGIHQEESSMALEDDAVEVLGETQWRASLVGGAARGPNRLQHQINEVGVRGRAARSHLQDGVFMRRSLGLGPDDDTVLSGVSPGNYSLQALVASEERQVRHERRRRSSAARRQVQGRSPPGEPDMALVPPPGAASQAQSGAGAAASVSGGETDAAARAAQLVEDERLAMQLQEELNAEGVQQRQQANPEIQVGTAPGAVADLRTDAELARSLQAEENARAAARRSAWRPNSGGEAGRMWAAPHVSSRAALQRDIADFVEDLPSTHVQREGAAATAEQPGGHGGFHRESSTDATLGGSSSHHHHASSRRRLQSYGGAGGARYAAGRDFGAGVLDPSQLSDLEGGAVGDSEEQLQQRIELAGAAMAPRAASAADRGTAGVGPEFSGAESGTLEERWVRRQRDRERHLSAERRYLDLQRRAARQEAAAAAAGVAAGAGAGAAALEVEAAAGGRSATRATADATLEGREGSLLDGLSFASEGPGSALGGRAREAGGGRMESATALGENLRGLFDPGEMDSGLGRMAGMFQAGGLRSHMERARRFDRVRAGHAAAAARAAGAGFDGPPDGRRGHRIGMSSERGMELLAHLEAVMHRQLPLALRLATLDRDFNENDYEMLLRLDDVDNGEPSRKGASSDVINRCPTNDVTAADVAQAASCVICIEEVVEGESLRSLPCDHRFHKKCIDTWLVRQALCPVCKRDVRDD